MTIPPTFPASPARRIVALLLVAMVAAPCGAIAPAAEGDARLDALMSALAQRRHGHATFIEHQYLAIIKRPLVSSGELYYDAPGRLEKRTLAPKPGSLLLDAGTVTVTLGKRTHALSLHDYPQLASLLESIRATLAGDRTALEQQFTLSPQFAGDDWTLGLVPRDAAVATIVARIRIAGVGDSVQEVEVRRADGDRSVMTIQELPDK